MNWNGENYETYSTIKSGNGLSHRETIHHIYSRMREGIFFAYCMGNVGLLELYTEENLPDSLYHRLYADTSECENLYSEFLFFRKKLEPWQLEKDAPLAPVAGTAKDEGKSLGDISAVPEHIIQEYKRAAAQESKGRRKIILALLYYAQGWRTERIAEELEWTFGDGKNIVKSISKGRVISKDKQLTDLSPYLAMHGRKGNTPSE